VSWEDAQAYIRKLSHASGRNYRLPSEAEWEYAARSGWKDEAEAAIDESLLMEYGGYIKNIGYQFDPVGPNALGLYDMAGNVWEWVSDWYGVKYYAESPRTNPRGPQSGSHRVLRAGTDSRHESQFAKRYGAAPDESHNYFGFRVVFPARIIADGQPDAQKPEISDSADPILKVESASGPASTQPFR
jgi:formylglycine-generating enzyme required for sulfatase activity